MSTGGKAIFDFTFPNDTINDDPLFTPPFATSNDAFWQLKFYRIDPDNRTSSVLYLIAIPNPEESLTTKLWEKRGRLSVMLYVKSEQYEKFNPIKTDKYSVRSYSWGVNFPLLQDRQKINVGIIFSDTTIERNQVNFDIISNQVSKELMSVWIGESNSINNIDSSNNIQLNFNDGSIFTQKSILIKRSEYFRKLFQETKETKEKKRKLNTTNTATTTTTINDNIIIVNVPECSRQSFLEIIQFMYTDRIEFNNNIVPMEIFKLADYYLIPDLRQKARVEIYKRLHFDNVVKILFSEGYKWKDLKDDMVDYIVSHFDKIKDTPEYKLLAVDNRGHPAVVILMQEIIATLFYKNIQSRK